MTVGQFSPVLILAFELDTETHLLRHHQAQRRVVNVQVPNLRRQMRTVRKIISFVICGDFLDVDRRWNSVESKVMRIDDADAVPR